ncbi:hypothetical protein [Nocardia transvalensis]|uniref:hypothetical protein n=1 Tax=Nocardia transvalensis TaxID=37333 RepID=UPI0018940CCD|nr:hypothetical protein [Nocardia transvalensis]MBF6333659.1 hypothetical protein [Nocardia transvalensis]
MSIETPGDDKRCDHCDAPGIPYEYKGRQFSGLTANRGERLCPRCSEWVCQRDTEEACARHYGMSVADLREFGLPITPQLPPELKGTDGQDLGKAIRRWTRRQRTPR